MLMGGEEEKAKNFAESNKISCRTTRTPARDD
jgi:hypothetical protein